MDTLNDQASAAVKKMSVKNGEGKQKCEISLMLCCSICNVLSHLTSQEAGFSVSTPSTEN